MNENTFWVSLWAVLGTIVVAISVVIHLNSVANLDAETLRFKTAVEAGLKQDIIQNRTIWVKP